MTTHPLSESRAAELWEVHIPERKTHYLGWQTFPEPSRRCFTAILRAAFDAGREHERDRSDPLADPTEITDEMRRAAASAYEDMAQVTRPENHEKCLNAALEAVLTVTTSADPRHDPRPWQDCTRKDIRKGDLVEAQYGAIILRIGVAHYQDEGGDWYTELGYPLSFDDRWTLRRIPAPTTTTKRETTMTEPSARAFFGVPESHGAPHHDVDAIRSGDFVVEVDKDGTTRSGVVSERDCDGDWYDERGDLLVWADYRADHPDAVTVWTAPPAEEVELPTEFGTIITDVEADFGKTCRYDHMVWTGTRWAYKYRSTDAESITAFTLPDGTRARRDGQYEDGSPRFIKKDA